MREERDPWSSIESPGEDHALNVRRANPEHPLDYWFARDVRGRYVFCLDSDAGATNALPSTLPKLASIELDALRLGDTRCRLVLTLLESEHSDIFRALCTDLMVATAALARHESLAGLKVTLQRLLRWQGLLKRARDDLLSRSKVIGLVGELLALRDLLLPRLSVFDAVQSWRGPYGDEQDFLVAGTIVEVKTQLSTSDRHLTISSEDQLDTTSGRILICHQNLDAPAAEEGGALSLNELVSSLAERMDDADQGAADLFQSALLEAGYRAREEYGRPYWLLNGRSFYEVREGFPRVVPQMLGAGIHGVRYKIALQACEEYEIDEESALNWAWNE